MKENGAIEVSIVLPAYNEADRIEDAVEKTIDFLKGIASTYEIIIAEDGSTDGTDKIASILSKKYPFVEHFHSDERLGRGRALRNAFENSRGKILAYMDVDLSTDIKHLKKLIDLIRGGYDIVTGSRMLPESKVERPFSRKIASSVYNFIVRFLFKTEIRDHQCGFKSFKRGPLLDLLNEVSASHWFWDTEILIRASRKKYRIKEISIEWKYRKKTKVNLLTDTIKMFIEILKLWWKIKFIREN